jgi:hypothetical protein
MAQLYSFVSGNNQNYLTTMLNDTTPMKNMNSVIIDNPLPKQLMLVGNQISHPNQGYPCTYNDPPSLLRPIQSAPFPKLMVIAGSDTEDINQGYPCTYTKVNIIRGVQDYPFPKLMIIAGEKTDGINQGYPCCFTKINVIRGVQDRPFPKLMPSFEEGENDGFLTFRKDFKGFGAGSNIETLEEIEIPRSVKYICDYAFYNTGIKRVRIARDCFYFRHSFPRGTQIAFYKD